MWYLLDERNILRAGSQTWDRAALDAGCPGAMSQAVLNLPLLHFVSGLETRSYLAGLFFQARQQGRVLSLPYRCDAPGLRRECVMDIGPGEEGTLRVMHSLLATHAVETIPPTPTGDAICSQCRQVHVDGQWRDTDMPDGGLSPATIYVTCPDCRRRALRIIGDTTIDMWRSA